MSNSRLLTFICIILLGIFAILLSQMNQQSPGEKIADGFGEAVEEIGDEIDDNLDTQ